MYYRCRTEKRIVQLKVVKKLAVDSRFLLQRKCCQIIDSRHIVSSMLQIFEAMKRKMKFALIRSGSKATSGFRLGHQRLLDLKTEHS